MFVSLRRAMISKSSKMPIPVNLNQSIRSVLDCSHSSPNSRRHSIRGRGNRRKWQLLMFFGFEQGFLDVYSDILLKLILMIFLIGKLTFPPWKRIDWGFPSSEIVCLLDIIFRFPQRCNINTSWSSDTCCDSYFVSLQCQTFSSSRILLLLQTMNLIHSSIEEMWILFC